MFTRFKYRTVLWVWFFETGSFENSLKIFLQSLIFLPCIIQSFNIDAAGKRFSSVCFPFQWHNALLPHINDNYINQERFVSFNERFYFFWCYRSYLISKIMSGWYMSCLVVKTVRSTFFPPHIATTDLFCQLPTWYYFRPKTVLNIKS